MRRVIVLGRALLLDKVSLEHSEDVNWVDTNCSYVCLVLNELVVRSIQLYEFFGMVWIILSKSLFH